MDLTFAYALGAGVVYLAGHVLTPTWRYRRKLRRAERRQVAEVGEGEVARIVGKVRATEPLLRSPLLGRPCVAYVTRVRQTEAMGPGLLLHDANAVPFVLDDATGHALVTATDAHLALAMTSIAEGRPIRALDPLPREFARSLHPDRRVDVDEGVIAEGDLVAVLGAGTREADPDAGPRELDYRTIGTRLVLVSSKRYPLTISNEPETLV